MNNWFDHIRFHLRTQPQRPAIVTEERVVTYEMLRTAIGRCARRLHGFELAGDAPVAILIANPIRHVALILALVRIGVPSVSLEHGQSGIGGLRFAAVLGDDKAKALVDPQNRFIEVADEWFETDPGGTLPAGFARADAVCRMILTSGTTGQPKYVSVSVQEFGVRIGGFTGGNWRSLLCLPGLSSGWTFNALGAAFTAGQTLCFANSPFQAARMIELFAIDYVVASTEQLLALTYVARKTGAQFRSLHMVEVSGSVPTAVLLQAAMVHVCKDVYCRYGTSELGPMARAAARDVLSRPGLAGYLLPGAEVRIVDASGEACPAGVVGRIEGRLDPRWNAAPSDTPWIDVGDLGWMSAEDELYVLGRPSDTSDASAQDTTRGQLSPVHEVEHLLRLEWDAADAAAVLVDDTEAQPAIWIATVDCADADAKKIEALLRTRGLDFPVRVFAMKSIPRGLNGKVQRTQLQSMLKLADAGRTGRT